jgi:hypothetical protein
MGGTDMTDKAEGYVCRHCGCRFKVTKEKEQVIEHGRAIEE